MIFTLPIYYTFERKTKADKKVLVGLNWYRNAHYFSSNQVKKHYLELIKEQIIDEELEFPLQATFMVYIKNQRTDPHNVRSVIEKFFYDALVELGIIPDDNLKYITETRSFFFMDAENPRIEIIVQKNDRS